MESEPTRRLLGPLSAPCLRLMRPSNGMPKRTIRASGREARQWMNRGSTGIKQLLEIVLRQQRHRRQGAARPLHSMLAGEDLHVPDGLAANAKCLLEHLDNHPPRLFAGRLVVEFHDDPVLAGILWTRPPDRGRDHLARHLAR